MTTAFIITLTFLLIAFIAYIIKKVYDDLASRLVTVSREMPAGLVSSRKAERLSVSLRQYITETPEGASLQIVAPFHPSDTSDEK